MSETKKTVKVTLVKSPSAPAPSIAPRCSVWVSRRCTRRVNSRIRPPFVA